MYLKRSKKLVGLHMMHMELVSSAVLYYNWRISLAPERSRCPRFGDFVACKRSGWRCDYPDVSDPWQTTNLNITDHFGHRGGQVFFHRNYQKLFWNQNSQENLWKSTAVVFLSFYFKDHANHSINHSEATTILLCPQEFWPASPGLVKLGGHVTVWCFVFLV